MVHWRNLVILIMLISPAWMCSVLFPRSDKTVPEPAIPTETLSQGPEVAKLRPLAGIHFSEQEIEYPEDWPTELKFPEKFKVVEGESGQVPDKSTSGWVIKLRFLGTPEVSAHLMREELIGKGWNIRDETPLDQGGFLLTAVKGSGQAVVVIVPEPENAGESQLLGIFFP